MLQSWDASISIFFNSFAHRWKALDLLVNSVSEGELLKGALALSIFFFVWFQSQDSKTTLEFNQKRQILFYSLFMCVPGVLGTRTLAWALPFRERPILTPALHLKIPYDFDVHSLISWSSFPSDNAVLFFALATGVYLVSRRFGILLYLHAILVICIPRLFLGIHYASDLLVGAIVGILLAYSSQWTALRSIVLWPFKMVNDYSTGLFYAGMFFMAHETSALYFHLGNAVLAVWHLVHGGAAHHLGAVMTTVKRFY